MRQLIKSFFAVLICFSVQPIEAVEIKYGFKAGNTYEYEYARQDSSKSSALKMNSSRNSPKTLVNFVVKVIAFQDSAYILDIGNKEATFRRYVKENGEIKGAPGETGQAIPFFLTFPGGDWKIGDKHQIRKDMALDNRLIPVTWNLLLKSVDREKEIAEILFSVAMKLPDDRLRQKEFAMKGRALFNLNEGVLQQAEWTTAYRFAFSNKEMAVTRALWSFDKQGNTSITLKGIREQ